MDALLINQKTLSSFEKLNANVDADKIIVAISEAQELDLRPFLGEAFYDDFIGNFSNANGIGSFILTNKITTAANGNYQNQALTNVTGSGTGAMASIQVYNGAVQPKIIITNPGTGYNSGDTVSCAAVPGALFTIDALTTELVISGGISTAYRNLFNGLTYINKSGHSINYKGIAPALAYFSLARYIENAPFEYTSTGIVSKNHDEAQAISQKDIAMIATRYRSKANAYANNITQYLWNNMTTYPLWRYNQRNKNNRQPGAVIKAIDRTDYNRAGYGGYNNNGLWPFEGGLF